jgi:hypothetical protein
VSSEATEDTVHQYRARIHVGQHVETVVVEASSVGQAKALIVMQYGDVLIGMPTRVS